VDAIEVKAFSKAADRVKVFAIGMS